VKSREVMPETISRKKTGKPAGIGKREVPCSMPVNQGTAPALLGGTRIGWIMNPVRETLAQEREIQREVLPRKGVPEPPPQLRATVV